MRKTLGGGLGCLSLFGLPFLVAGLLVLRQVLAGRSGRDGMPPFLGFAFGLTFAATGGGLVFGPLLWRGYLLRRRREEDVGRFLPEFAHPFFVPLVFGVGWNLVTWTVGIGFAAAAPSWTTLLPLGLFAAVGVVTAGWLVLEIRLRWALGRFRLVLPAPPRAGRVVDWRLEGPRDRLRAPTFELAFRSETRVDGADGEVSWERRDLRTTALEATSTADGWAGAFPLREPPEAIVTSARIRNRWVIRVRDGRRKACFPLCW